MSFSNYMLQQEKVRTAIAEREAASLKLELARIHERLAELKSQHEPLNSLKAPNDLSPRGRLYSAAFYAVIGRLPGKGEED